MHKMSVLIVDDEPLAHEIVIDYLAEVNFVSTIHQGYSAAQAIDLLHDNEIDIMFLDINMPRISGIELLQSLETTPQVIITSAHRQFALESFELSVCDYLLKPFRQERFLKALNKAVYQIQLRLNNADNVRSDSPIARTLFIKVDKKLIHIAIEDIESLEAYGNYVKVWTGETSVLTPRTLSSFETELDNNNSPFIRSHKSYLINPAHIKSIENNTVLLNSGRLHPIGKTFRTSIKTQLIG